MVRSSLEDQNTDALDNTFIRLNDNSYLRGYWKNERLFLGTADPLKEEFRFKTKPSPLSADMKGRITHINSISLHIRGGDYLGNMLANATHDTRYIEYYEKALAHITASQRDALEVVIFSDDPTWVHDNLQILLPRTIVDINDSDRQYENMRLMSL
jgi:hypothetical protein